ncbi:MAG: hypothetical protein ACO1NZ_13095 [Adhaeribacter sp.]
MKISFLAFSCLLLASLALPARGAGGPGPGGARAAALAGAAGSLTDVWAVRNNIAGIAAGKKPALAAGAENRFNLKAFTTVSFVAALPLQTGTALGLELSRFGDKIYNEQQAGLGLAHQLGPVRLGLKATLWQVHLESLGSKRTLALSFGGQAEVVPQLSFAAHVFNFNQARLARDQEERLPTIMAAGLTYQPATKILLSLQAEKHISQPAGILAGLEYVLADKLALRTGLSPGRQTLSGGAGWKSRTLQVDYALGGHAALGLRNQVSVSYLFP